jgi:hypothetical protein
MEQSEIQVNPSAEIHVALVSRLRANERID